MIESAWAAAGTQSQSLWDYLWVVWHGTDGQLILLSFVCIFVGLFTNYLVRWAKDEIVGSLWCYLMHQTPRRTTLSVFGCISAVGTMLSSQTFWTDGNFIGWNKAALICFLAGYAIDNSINKGERPQWTKEERDVKGAIAAADNHPGLPRPPVEP